MIITNSRHALIGYFITSYPTQAHGIIVIYLEKRTTYIVLYAGVKPDKGGKVLKKLWGVLQDNLVLSIMG